MVRFGKINSPKVGPTDYGIDSPEYSLRHMGYCLYLSISVPVVPRTWIIFKAVIVHVYTQPLYIAKTLLRF